jgi:hypothetical protein
VLRVQLTAQGNAGAPNNKIVSIHIIETRNATLEMPEGGGSGFHGNFQFGLSAPSTSFTFLIDRAAAGAFIARYEVNDACGPVTGPYKLFAGGGTGVQ